MALRVEKELYLIYIKHFIPIKEMDNVVRELCDALDYRFKTLSKNFRSNECLACCWLYWYVEFSYIYYSYPLHKFKIKNYDRKDI